jgi:hypothetical protein
MTKIHTVEMKFIRLIKKCSVIDKIRHEEIRKELEIQQKKKEYRVRWLQYVQRINAGGITRHEYMARPEARNASTA